MGKFTVLAASAAALFAAGVLTTARADEAVKCSGINSCKGKNSCKGLGWINTSSAKECTTKGGKVL